jgi:predicted metalloendopeptidase
MWQVTAMFTRLKVTFDTRIKSLSWLDEPTRKEALNKLASLRGHFLTWPQLWNQTYVGSLLEDVSCHALCMWHYVCSSVVPCLSNSLLQKLRL